MNVTGFTIIKNAIHLAFPVQEAILSILPLCNEMVVAVGRGNDGTRELIASLEPDKIRIIDTVWDENLNTGGQVLANETNKAFQAIGAGADWCFYIQADEVLHEQYHNTVYNSMLQWKDDQQVDGLLFNYLHFYGSYDYIGTSSRWYRKEIRIVRNNKNIYSYRDAQGFRKGNNEKLRVKEVDACMYHYGWVREPETMKAKAINATKLWGGNTVSEETLKAIGNSVFDYSDIDALDKFKGTHPAVMQERVARINWAFDFDISHKRLKLKDRVKNFLEKHTGKRFFDYENYTIF